MRSQSADKKVRTLRYKDHIKLLTWLLVKIRNESGKNQKKSRQTNIFVLNIMLKHPFFLEISHSDLDNKSCVDSLITCDCKKIKE